MVWMTILQSFKTVCFLCVISLQSLNSQAQSVIKIASGDSHTLFLKSDNSLWVTGNNAWGQLGDGTYNKTNQPEQIVASEVTAIAAGQFFSLFLKSDGSLWAMGCNSWGQLGDGTLNNKTNLPEKIVSSGVTAIAGGGNHSLFLKEDGSLWAMGSMLYGQVGNGKSRDAGLNRPEQIMASNVTAIAAGFDYSLFVKSDGSLWGMGNNNRGQLGDGTSKIAAIFPEQIEASGVKVIAAGGEGAHSLFLKTDGSLWAMGCNICGQLGDGTINDVHSPIEIIAGGVTSIATGWMHSLLLKSDGSLLAMGRNQYGQVGYGTYITNAPFQIINSPTNILASNVKVIGAGANQSFFVKSDGSLWVMGNNIYGQLGDGTYGDAE
jgi:alpha-tubulin suppressor-like RCC1 family protein